MRGQEASCRIAGVARKGFGGKLQCEQRFTGSEGVSLVDVWGGGRGSSQCKGPRAGGTGVFQEQRLGSWEGWRQMLLAFQPFILIAREERWHKLNYTVRRLVCEGASGCCTENRLQGSQGEGCCNNR